MHIFRVLALVVVLAAGAAHADVEPIGDEFQANTYTLGEQGIPAVAGDASGRFVVVWQSGSEYYGSGPDGSRTAVRGRRFDSAGVAQGAEFQANTYTIGPQGLPAVAMSPGGEFTVAWQGGNYTFEQDGSNGGAFLQQFTAVGAKKGSERRINTIVAGFQGNPSMAFDPAGRSVAVWESFPAFFGDSPGGDGSGAGIFGQRYDADGAAMGGQFQVNAFTTGTQSNPVVAADSAGGFVVVWQSYGYGIAPPRDPQGVFARRFDSSGLPIGDEFAVNTRTSGFQGDVDVAMAPDGGFVVTWSDGNYLDPLDGDETGVAARRFDPLGIPASGEFQVNSYTTGYQTQPDIAADAEGNFLIVWTSGDDDSGPDGDGNGIFAQHFAADGQRVGGELQVNVFTTADQSSPSVAATGDGDFVVAWRSGNYYGVGQDGSQGGVFGRRVQTTGFEPMRRVAGGKLVLKTDANARNRRLSARAIDPGIGIGAGTRDDPRVSGGSVRVRSALFDHTYPLPAANWRQLGSPSRPKGWSYRDSGLLAGPISDVSIRGGQLKVTGKGAQLLHALPSNPDPVTLIVQLGARGVRHCIRLGGTTEFRPEKYFRGKKAPAPASCD